MNELLSLDFAKTHTAAEVAMAMKTIQEYLGPKAGYLLEFSSPRISTERLHLRGPDFVDRIYFSSDHNNRVLIRRVSELVQRFYGSNPPRIRTIFEALVNGIACQQLSLAVGITLLNRLAEAYGLPFAGPERKQYAFPTPKALASGSVTELKQLGFSSNIRAGL